MFNFNILPNATQVVWDIIVIFQLNKIYLVISQVILIGFWKNRCGDSGISYVFGKAKCKGYGVKISVCGMSRVNPLNHNNAFNTTMATGIRRFFGIRVPEYAIDRSNLLCIFTSDSWGSQLNFQPSRSRHPCNFT